MLLSLAGLFGWIACAGYRVRFQPCQPLWPSLFSASPPSLSNAETGSQFAFPVIQFAEPAQYPAHGTGSKASQFNRSMC